MATLSITKTYADDVLLSAADLDAILDAVEAFVNVTGLNDDNINNDTILASSKIKTATITSSKLQDGAVTEDKLNTGAVTTTKILDANVTNPKLANNSLVRRNFEGLLPLSDTGTVVMFHTFNGTVSVPRGWVPCKGDVLTEGVYDAIHGAGAFEEDSISSSALFAKFLPDMVDKFATGTSDTTATGASAIPSIGAPGNQANVNHTHTLNSHTHNDSKSLAQKDVWTGNTGADIGDLWQPAVGPGTVLNTLGSTTVDPEVTLDVTPESIEFIFIIKVV